jgi:hypothetical protein
MAGFLATNIPHKVILLYTVIEWTVRNSKLGKTTTLSKSSLCRKQKEFVVYNFIIKIDTSKIIQI